MGGRSSLSEYAARSKRVAANAYCNWATALAEQPAVVAMGTAQKPGPAS